MKWDSLVYHAVTNGIVEQSNLDDITTDGLDFYGAPDEVIAEQKADTEYGIGYHNGRPCIFSVGDGGYYMPVGFIYEQKFTGLAWMVEKDA